MQTSSSNAVTIQPHKPKRAFTPEQKKFLADSLMALNTHLLKGKNSSEQADLDKTFWGTPVDDLSKQELAKHDTNILDIWSRLVEHDKQGKMAEGIDDFMFRHYGMFNVEPNSQGYMCRMRIPSCKIRGDQLRALGDMAENIAGGYTHLTTRGNFQFREIMPNRLIEWITALNDYGLSCHGTGADSARNITASPIAGFDPFELIDLHQYGIDLGRRILNTRDLQGLPRKFNFSFDNGGSISVVSDTNDVGYVATQILENDQDIEPGIYCRLILGGITGHKDFARDTGIICKPEDTVEISEAILRVFLDHGDRTNRNKARFKYVLDKHGFDWTIERIQDHLDAFGHGVKLLALDAKFDAPRVQINRQGHIGVHPQSQAGLNYIGVTLNVGHMTPEQMRRIADIAMRYGKNDVRMTVWQNILVPHIADADVAAVVSEIEAMGLSTSATAFAAGAISCTGRWGCKLANAYTKQDTETLVKHLQERFELDQPINIHTTGCKNSCAQHYIGDIGLIGASGPDGGEGYNIFVGGGTDQDQGLARHLHGPINASDLPQWGEKIIHNYLKEREQGESFLTFTRRHQESDLQAILLR